MLIVKTEIKESSHGFGLFSAQFIKAGQAVWVWDDTTEIIIDEREVLSDTFKEFLETYSYKVNGLGLVVNLDNARFMNHSDNPNLIEINGSNFAARDIDVGEELTCDYNVFDYGLEKCGSFLNNAAGK